MRFQFNGPTTISGVTYGKGQHDVPAADVKANQWFVDAMTKEGKMVEVKAAEEAPAAPAAPVAPVAPVAPAKTNVLDGNAKDIIAAIPALNLDADGLDALADEEAAGKNRKSVLDAIAAAKASL